jgi:hypothetical protein
MTEAQWLACADPLAMLDFLERRASERKLRLFACACCRRVWEALRDQRSRRGVEMAERFADGLVGRDEFESAAFEARKVGDAAAKATWTEPRMEVALLWANRTAYFTASMKVRAAAEAATARDRPVAEAVEIQWTLERHCQADLLRDLFGTPFRPAGLDSAWLTPDVRALAAGVYEDRAFERMPILGDALEDAGCTDGDVLSHCRASADHARGCWLVDLLLGKK